MLRPAFPDTMVDEVGKEVLAALAEMGRPMLGGGMAAAVAEVDASMNLGRGPVLGDVPGGGPELSVEVVGRRDTQPSMLAIYAEIDIDAVKTLNISIKKANTLVQELAPNKKMRG